MMLIRNNQFKLYYIVQTTVTLKVSDHIFIRDQSNNNYCATSEVNYKILVFPLFIGQHNFIVSIV